MGALKINLSQAFAGQRVGVKQVEDKIWLVSKHPGWGAPKIREKLRRLHTEISLPAISTVHAVLDRHGHRSTADIDWGA